MILLLCSRKTKTICKAGNRVFSHSECSGVTPRTRALYNRVNDKEHEGIITAVKIMSIICITLQLVATFSLVAEVPTHCKYIRRDIQ